MFRLFGVVSVAASFYTTIPILAQAPGIAQPSCTRMRTATLSRRTRAPRCEFLRFHTAYTVIWYNVNVCTRARFCTPSQTPDEHRRCRRRRRRSMCRRACRTNERGPSRVRVIVVIVQTHTQTHTSAHTHTNATRLAGRALCAGFGRSGLRQLNLCARVRAIVSIWCDR